MTIKALYPSISPSLMLDFANTKALDPRITFTRTTTATYYDGVTTAKAEENLLIRSQEFEDAGWINSGTTETANTSAAPDGTTTADTLDDGTATSAHDVGQTFTATSGVTYTLSAFFKDVDRQFVILACSSGPNAWASAKFDLTAGTAGSTAAAGSGWSTTSSSITSVGSGWFRCTITFVSGTTGGVTVRLGMATDGTTFTAAQRGLESYTGTNATVEIWGAQLEQRSAVTAYTPTTTQPITNYIPVLLTAASGVARFDHNPTTGESLGLLVEEQRTNLLVRSEEFDNASWSKARASVVANTVVAPDGTLTGDKLVANTDSNTHNIQQGATVVASSTNTVSVYMKAGEYTWGSITANNGSTFPSGYYNLATGVVGSFVSGASGSIQSVGNGWYRCTMTFTMASGTTPTVFLLVAEGDNDQSFAGDGFSGIYIWGAQLEAGAFPTSYIPTVAATVTRNADAASMTGTNFSSWYRADEGTLYAEWAKNGTLSFQSIASISNNTSNNLITLAHGSISGANNNMRFDINIGGASQASLTLITGSVVGTFYKTIGAYKTNDFAGVANAGTVLTDATGTIPVVDMIYIGSSGVGSALLNGHIKKLAYYSTRATNAQLQALTS